MTPKVGDLLNPEMWDETSPKGDRFNGPARVVKVETDQYSQTGIMVTVVQVNPRSTVGCKRIDFGWFSESRLLPTEGDPQ